MQSLNHRRSHKKIYIATMVIALLAIATFSYLYATKAGPFTQTKSSSSNESDSKPTAELPMSNEDLGVEDPKATDPTSNSIKNNTKNPDSNIDNEKLIEITAAYQNEDNYVIRTLIKKLTTSGTCQLTMKSSRGSYAASSGVQASASSSTCKGFNVPMTQLSPGTWTIQLTFTDKVGTSNTTKEVTIDA